MEVGVRRYSDKLGGLFHGIKELIVVVLVAGLTFSWPCTFKREKLSSVFLADFLVFTEKRSKFSTRQSLVYFLDKKMSNNSAMIKIVVGNTLSTREHLLNTCVSPTVASPVQK